MIFRLAKICFGLVLAICSASASAQQNNTNPPIKDKTASYKAEVLLSNLDSPVGLALRPTRAKQGPYELFIAESGAGRVLRLFTDKLQQASDAINGFAVEEQQDLRAGPLGLGFINRKKLVVGLRAPESNSIQLVGYTLSDDEAVNAVEQDHSVSPLKPSGSANALDFLSIAMTETMCYVSTSSSDGEGMIYKAGIEANRLAYLRPVVDLKKTEGLKTPGGVAVIPHPRPTFLVATMMGTRAAVPDSRLLFFVPSDGSLALDLPTGLHDIVSLAYSPSGQLYAADFSWHDQQAGGVYRLDDAKINGKQICQPVKIAAVTRPVTLAFAPDGSLFVTTLGASKDNKQGTLLKITGDL